MNILSPILSAQLFCLALLAILFLQSGLDKVFNYKGNMEWLTGHFSKSPLKGTVGILMPVITILEVAAGILCVIGILTLLISGNTGFGLLGSQLSAISLLSLFFGQRLAQQYEGAATLIPYFLVTIVSIYLLS